MIVKKITQNKDGTYEIVGIYTKTEMEVSVEAGLNLLLQTGSLPFTTDEETEFLLMSPEPELKQ